MNKLDQAVAEWQRAMALRPDSEVKAALDKALRDKREEESYRENESAHFNLKYNGAAEPSLARDVLRTLEQHFSEIESQLSYTPRIRLASFCTRNRLSRILPRRRLGRCAKRRANPRPGAGIERRDL